MCVPNLLTQAMHACLMPAAAPYGTPVLSVVLVGFGSQEVLLLLLECQHTSVDSCSYTAGH